MAKCTEKKLVKLIIKNEDLNSRYYIIKDMASKIINWTPPVDTKASDIPPYYTDHGVAHSERILNILDRLTVRLDLEIFEIFPLLCSVWLHDIGMFVGRKTGEPYETTRKMHHLRSVEFVKQEVVANRLPLDEWQLQNVLDICRAHRSIVNFDEEPKIPKERPFEDKTIRLQLLCSLLRFADACDVHHSRAPEAIFQIYKESISRISQEHWKKHFRIGQVRFNWDRACVEIPILIPEDDVEKMNEQRRIARSIKDELSAELQTVEYIFEEYKLKLFHIAISDYNKGVYLNFSHFDNKETLGWVISPFAKKALAEKLDVLIFQPILAQEEVKHCYVEISIVKELAKELEESDFSKNYLFLSHPRTGKTSMLAYLSALATNKGLKVFWFARQSNVPSCQELILKLSVNTSLDKGTIIVFDNIHEDKQILTLVSDLKKEKPDVTIWCASRISEFVDLRDRWTELGEHFIEREAPGFLDNVSITSFLDRYRELVDDEAEKLIFSQQNITAYYLVNIYMKLKSNTLAEKELLPKDIVAQVSIDLEEDNRKTFGSLREIERLALKIISYLDVTPRILLERCLERTDSDKGKGVVESLLARKIVFSTENILYNPNRVKVEAICIFDSFKDFVMEQMYELDTKTVIPSLLLDGAKACQDEMQHALLVLINKYTVLERRQKEQMKNVIFANRDNHVALWVASYLAAKDEAFLQLADHAYKMTQVSPEIIATYGMAFFRVGKESQSIVFFEKALESEPNKPNWLHFLAHSYEEVSNLESAVKFMEQAARLSPKHYDCLGVLYSKMGQEEKAIECYNKLISKNQANSRTWHNLAISYKRKNQIDKARECLETAIEINPQNVLSYRALADIYFISKNMEKAKEYSQLAIYKEEDDQHSWDLLAKILDKMGKYRESIQALEKAVELNPEESRYYYTLGYLYNKVGEFENSIMYYSQAIEKNPEYVEAYINRGACYYNQKNNYGAALKDFETALSINPSHALAKVCLGNVLLTYGEIKRAQKEYKTALCLDKGEKETAHQSARIRLQEIKDKIKKIKTDYYCMMQQTNERDAEALNEIAYRMIMAGLYDKVLNVLEIGLEKDPNDSYTYATKGLYYFHQGDVDTGLEYYLKSIRLAPKDIALKQKFHYEYGRVLRINNSFEAATKELQLAISIGSDFVLKEMIEAEIIKSKQNNNYE